MDQAEIDATNRLWVEQFLKRIAPGEMIGSFVTIRMDAKGLGWYPVLANQSGDILDLLRQKPDEVRISLIDKGRHGS